MFSKFTHNLNMAVDFIIVKRYVFATIFFSVSFFSFTFLYVTGLIPAEFRVVQTTVEAAPDSQEMAQIDESPVDGGRTEAALPSDARGELPTRIFINKIGVNASISNPGTTDPDVLDTDLGRGAVRYPTSGKLGEGNLFLFGHSTNHPIVNNQAYKTFNNLDKLAVGDEIVVESATHLYVYRVFSVRLTTADEALIDLASDRNMLTISTCNTFGKKQERFVVQADFVKAEAR